MHSRGMSTVHRRAHGADMASTFLELIEAERERVQALRTHFVIVSALQAELDQRVGEQELIYGNTTLHSMVVEHRLGLVQRLAGWVQALCGAGGFLDRIIADHLNELAPTDDELAPTDDDDIPAIETDTRRACFERRFPHAAPTGIVTKVDIEAIRSSILEQAAPILENCDVIRRWRESATGTSSPEPLTLNAVNAFISAAEELVNDFRCAHDGIDRGFSDHDVHPSPRVVARDLVDLTLLGSIDRMLSVTGVDAQLGASGAWWRQYRDGFWEALTKAAKENPRLRFNAPELVRTVATRIESQPLTTPQIEKLVSRYVLEYARYETAARHVEDRLRRMLVRERVKALIGSRAKDPESLRGKLERKRESKKYRFRELDADLGSVVTDLAGLRVVLYDDEQIKLVVELIKQTWTVLSDDPYDSEYQARHITIRLQDTEQRAIDGAVCEIQLASLASHAFNELEHDIRYKDQNVAPGANVDGLLEVVRQTTGALRAAIRRLLAARKEELVAKKTAITSAMDLGAALDRRFGRRMNGDFEALLWLWQGVVAPEPLTHELIERVAPILFERAGSSSLRGADDATRFAFALASEAPREVKEMAREYRDQDSALIRAILHQSASS